MLFDTIAPIYALFFNYQVRYYRKVLDRMKDWIDVDEHNKILDFGCGTGALSYALQERGLEVVGVDTSAGMLRRAKNKLQDTGVKLIKIEPGEDLPFDDDSFDLAISSFVIHGLKPEERRKVYGELSRVSKADIVFHDYNRNRSIITDIAEYLERGDYFNFIKVAEGEMKEFFDSVRIVDVDKRAAWYIIKKARDGCDKG
ncbi:MAG TPA: class I SAM-dependent methyltransferase [Clostridia bacterium]|nr:class I SAM-dependent methyltransferase [Clostridia bacterium]